MSDKIKIGRNEPCPCGSGKKFKKCCGQATTARNRPHPSDKSIHLDVREEPLEHVWDFGNVKVIHGNTKDLFRDAIMTEDRVKGLLVEMHKEMETTGWTPGKSPNIFFSFHDQVAEKWIAQRSSWDHFSGRMRDPGESIPLGFSEVFKVDISGIQVDSAVFLYPKLIKSEMMTGSRINVLHTICHEYAHSFGLNYRSEAAFNEKTRFYWEVLADYFSLNAIQRAAPWLETADLHRHIYYLSKEYQRHQGYQVTSNANLCEFAERFLRQAGVLPCPIELWCAGEIGYFGGGAS